MLQQDADHKVKDEVKRYHFSKGVILEIVRAVERGAKRRDVIDRYWMAKSTLSDWMREHGSPAYHASINPSSVTDRRSLVRNVEEGWMTLAEAKVAYNLCSTVVVKRYLREAEREKAELRKGFPYLGKDNHFSFLGLPGTRLFSDRNFKLIFSYIYHPRIQHSAKSTLTCIGLLGFIQNHV